MADDVLDIAVLEKAREVFDPPRGVRGFMPLQIVQMTDDGFKWLTALYQDELELLIQQRKSAHQTVAAEELTARDGDGHFPEEG